MPSSDEIRVQLEAAQATVVSRLAVATDPTEIASLTSARDKLDEQLDLVDQNELLGAAAALAAATAALQEIVDTARTDPAQQFVEQVGNHIDTMGEQQKAAHLEVAHPPAEVSILTPAGATSVSRSVRFADIAQEYQAMFASCVISPGRLPVVQQSIAILRGNRARYSQVAAHFTNMSWQFVGALHAMEASFNFRTHLHNGDPLTARTVHVPAGRPPTGNPPFSWEQSAQDALSFENFDRESDFTVPRVLYLFEHYNGMGYRQFGLASPYLWSFSNHYVKGKFQSDGKFSPTLVSQQAGAAVLLKALQQSSDT